jgi:rSAM/selenodomain-associated transferase 1
VADARPLVIVFSRAPQPGRAKTRLHAVLGPHGAAALQARLTQRALATAQASGFAIELCCSPHARGAFFADCRRRYGARLSAQGSGDLGERMHRALERGLARHRVVLLMGADCPSLRAAHLRSAARALASGCDAAFSPAEDGGYALVGVTRIAKQLFKAVEWGTPGVMSQTRAQLRALRWRWTELEKVWDVDRPADHARLLRSRLLAREP